ncbi:MAG: hypothetical protein KDJ77_01155 [Rhodobiaceae bacterium]|nr:hypothetical protein [Rhodobiaceae bacterium]
MSEEFLMPLALRLVVPLVAALTCCGPGLAADQFSEASLDGVGQVDDSGTLWAALSIRMQPHWKTYWRNPGDAGIPPRFDWSGSVNLKTADIVWPAPQRFFDGYSNSIGYPAPEVVLPLRIVPENPDRPVVLSLLLDYAVCEKICVPEQAELSGFVRPQPADPQAAEILGDALDAVPAEADAAVRPVITSVRLDPDGKALTVTLADTVPEAGLDLFAEGPQGEPLLVPQRLEPASPVTFRVPLQSLADGQKAPGTSYRFTVVWNGGSADARAPIE